MAQVWEWSNSEGTDLLVMLALADFCDDEGECYPGIARISRKCRVSERSVQRSVKTLCSMGELSVDQHKGVQTKGGATNRFYVTPKGGDKLTGGDKHGEKVVTPMSPKPSVINHQSEEEGAAEPPTSFELISHGLRKLGKPKRKPFEPPTKEECRAYAFAGGYKPDDGEHFWLSWQSKGWCVGETNVPLREWKPQFDKWALNGWLPSQKASHDHKDPPGSPPSKYASRV